MAIFLNILVIALIGAYFFFNQKSFGTAPSGKRLERIKNSPNFKDGEFKNLSETVMMTEDASYFKMTKQFFVKDENREPSKALPVVKRDLKEKPGAKPEITWFGHSSLFIQLEGKNILVDPVFTQRPSPVAFAGSKSYAGTDIYSLNDLPSIDYVIITHDHYDHLDYKTMEELAAKNIKFYTALGVGTHLEYWGVKPENITEFDWWEEGVLSPEIKIACTPARHFSGRSLWGRNKTLWASYVLTTPSNKIYLGGDSGYDTHFKQIGEKYGPFDIVLLECGQYDNYWPFIHMMPEETVQASKDLKGKVLMPIHWGKFSLALHPWQEPITRALSRANEDSVQVTTPKIGEKVVVNSIYPTERWWSKEKEVVESVQP